MPVQTTHCDTVLGAYLLGTRGKAVYVSCVFTCVKLATEQYVDF